MIIKKFLIAISIIILTAIVIVASTALIVYIGPVVTNNIGPVVTNIFEFAKPLLKKSPKEEEFYGTWCHKIDSGEMGKSAHGWARSSIMGLPIEEIAGDPKGMRGKKSITFKENHSYHGGMTIRCTSGFVFGHGFGGDWNYTNGILTLDVEYSQHPNIHQGTIFKLKDVDVSGNTLTIDGVEYQRTNEYEESRCE